MDDRSLSVRGRVRRADRVRRERGLGVRWRRAHVVRCIRPVPSQVDRVGLVEHRDALGLLRVEHDLDLEQGPDLEHARVDRQALAAHRVLCPDLARSRGCVLQRVRRRAVADSGTRRPRKAR